MSSIFGIFYKHKSIPPRLAQNIAHRINHWQADRIDSWHDQSTALGCLQLFNTAESLNERQPIQIGTCVCVADCRIDNRIILCEQLNLNSNISDAEMIAHAYLKWGITCTEHLLGDFACIIWDQKDHKMYCARDQIGIKPLFYYNDYNLFAVATEIKAILMAPEINCSISEKNIAHLLTDNIIMNCNYSERTLYNNIFRLTPAHQCVVTHLEFFKSQYWDLNPNKPIKYTDENNYIDQYKTLLQQSVKDRMRCHRNVASELSGGLDSSAVTAQASRFDNNLHAFTHVSPGTNPLYLDESKYAYKLCQYNQIKNHHLIDASTYNLSNATKYSLLVADQPLLLNNPILANNVHKKVAEKNCSILLSGFGGDECATSHAVYRLYALARQKSWLTLWCEIRNRALLENKKTLRPFVSHYMENQFYLVLRALKSLKLKRSISDYRLTDLIINPNFAKKHGIQTKICSRFDRLTYQTVNLTEYHKLVGSESWHLRARIECAQLCGLGLRFEYRYPLLDIRLLEFCLNVPDDMKRRFGFGRYLARKSLEDLLPFELQWRYDKAGSPVPATLYYVKEQGHLAQTLRNTMLSKKINYYFGEINVDKFTQKNRTIALFAMRSGMQALALEYFFRKYKNSNFLI